MRGLLTLLLFAGLAHSQPLEVGFGSADVTPDISKPVYLAGFGHNRLAKSIHAPIEVRAMVLKHGDRRIAMASVDVVGLFLPTVERIRGQLPNFEYVMVGATHNHNGPDTMGLWGPSNFKSGVNPEYIKTIEAKVVEAITAAAKSVKPAIAVIGKANAPELLRDSRKPIVLHDELVALQFRDPTTQAPLGVVVQWNCHPETLDSDGTKLSPDYIAFTRNNLAKKYGCPVLYLTGTVGGLLTTMRVEIKDEGGKVLPEGSVEKTERYGALLADVTVKAFAKAEPVTLTPFVAKTKSLAFPVDNPLYLMAKTLGVLDRAMEPMPDGRKGVRSEVGLLRLGELDVAIMPGEVYPELVLGKVPDPAETGADFPDAPVEPAIYTSMKGKHKMLIGLGNDELGYILPKRQWDEKPPFAYGLTKAPYGEVNSLGRDTAAILCLAFRELCQ